MKIKTAATIVVMSCFFLVTASPRADEPVDCANASSTAEINTCADAELARTDAAMNEAYKRALAAIPALASEKPYDAKSWDEALRASQRAWVAYRDAECKGHVPMFWSGGSGTSAEVLGCMTTMTRERTKLLNDSYAKP